VGYPDYARDPRFSSNAKRHALRPEIVERIQQVLRQKPRDEWLELFEKNAIPSGPINRIDEIASDAELARRGFLYSMQMGDITVPQVGLGITIDRRPAVPRSAPPALGADTASVLFEIAGISDADLAEYKNASIV
jgi:crotonobetainyl-CoA:carnitine CoA-transferase CaiB-like acyl-CoA transferase